MTKLRLIVVSLLYHWRMNLAVAAGVAAGTAVLTGALLVGDSMRGSLRRLTLDRLGRIDQVLLTERFFRAGLADELAAGPEFQKHFDDAVPVVMLRASLENPGNTQKGTVPFSLRENRDSPQTQMPVRANRVNLIGCDGRFWKLGSGGPRTLPGKREIVLNRTLAERLGAEVGDSIVLRLPRPGTIPADTPLGRRRETVGGHRLTLSAIIPTEGLGRFTLQSSQQQPLNGYVSLGWLQDRLQRPGRANAILVAGQHNGQLHNGQLGRLLKPKLEDYGIRVRHTERGYFDVVTERLLLEPAAEKALVGAAESGDLPKVQPVLTYLANTIACGSHELPYSTVAAMDFADRPPLGPLLAADGSPIAPLAEDQIVLNRWAADDLQAAVGETIRLSYFEPESTHGEIRQRTVELKLAAIAQLAAAADDPALTPEVPGVTDRLSIADWQPPFPFDARRIRPKDEQYWNDHAATPKGFVSLATGRRLWGSRFGRTTSLRIPPAEVLTIESIEATLTPEPAAMGFVFQPVKQQGLAASAGTTPFNVLFLCFSFFIIAAAVMLVGLLFRLGIDHRAREVGILLATGFSRRQVGRLLAAEGLLVAAAGSLAGILAGVGYAALMLAGLRTWWLAAVVTPFLRLCIGWDTTPVSLLAGYLSGLVVALAAIWWSVRGLGRVAAAGLLAGRTADTAAAPSSPSSRLWKGVRYVFSACASDAVESRSAEKRTRPRAWGEWVGMGLIAALVLGLLGLPISDEMQPVAFFAAGAFTLAVSLGIVRSRLRRGATGPAVAVGRGNLLRMALRNAARNPTRSTLTVGLVASACFLIVSVSAFHLDPTQQAPSLNSGNGGFALVGESDQSIYHDLNTPQGRAELGFSAEDSRLLAGCKVISLRVQAGDDASCLNLYQPRQPRMLGIPQSLIERGGFAWAAAPKGSKNPWRVLEPVAGPATETRRPLPVIIEKNTANYSLHLWKGLGEPYQIVDHRGRAVPLEVAALLAGSIFPSDLLVSEQALLECYPQLSGYRFFLVETGPGRAAAVRAALERTLGDYGFAAETSGQRLARFLAVQNTYLSTFQSLGGLGLLLGTFGLAAVQLRNVLERRGELALLRATGFRRRALGAMVLMENGLLLGAGLAGGCLAALVAVLPHLLSRTAAIPWASLSGTLATVLAVGLVAGAAAVRAALSAPLLRALSEES